MTMTGKIWKGPWLNFVFAAVFVTAASNFATGQVGLVDFDGVEIGLTGYSNDALVGGGLSTNGNLASSETYALFTSSGDAFNPMSRASLSPMEADGNQVGMPFSVSDDSVAPRPATASFLPIRRASPA